MKKITILAALLVSAIGIGQNLSQENAQPVPGQSFERTAAAVTVDNSPSAGLAPQTRSSYNGVSYHNPERSMMPVLAYTSGPYFSVAGSPDVSLLEDTTLGMGTYGAGVQISAGNRIAEDIILADDYDVTSMDFFAYQSFTPTAPPTIDAINVQIWDGDPSLGTSSVIYGDDVTNVLTSVVWSGAYRQLESSPNTDRAIHRITVETPGLSLAAGTYWVDWQIGGTAASGPWQPPVAILGQATTGNAMQSIGGVWAPLEDGGTFTAQGAPIEVNGDCTSCGGGGGGGPVVVYAIDNSSLQFGSFEIDTPEVYTPIAGSPSVGFEGAGAIDPNSDGSTAYAFDDLTLYSIDTATGVYTSLGTITPSSGGSWVGMEFDPTSGTLYGLAGNFGIDVGLYTIDVGAVTATLVGTSSVTTGAVTLAIDGAGVGYITDVVSDSLYSIDVATGAVTLVGALGVDLNFGQGMVYDINSDQVYTALFNNFSFAAEWWTVDTATGAATFVGTIDATNPNVVQVGWAGIPSVSTNDECSGAIAVACGETVTGTTVGDTDSGGSASADEFFSFTGTGSVEFVTASLCNNTDFDTIIRIYEDCTLVNEIANNDDFCGLFGPSQVSFVSDGTSTYYIMVEGFDAPDVGNFELTITCDDVAANDLCENAIAVGCDSVTAGSTLMASIDDDVAGDCDGVGVTSAGVWYTYTETIPGLISDITLSTCDDADFDTKISVYEGDCGALTCVAANDDGAGCGAFTSELTFQSDGVSTYYILVHGFGGAVGDFNLSVSCLPVAPFNDPIVNSIDVDEAGLPYTDPAVNMPGATTEAGGTPAVCDNAGVLGVWYNFVPEMGGTATATVVSPAGYTSVTFYTAPNEDAVETDLTLVDWFDNQCVPGITTSIPVTAGQAYYVYVANHEGVTDIVIDGDFYLGVGDAVVDGFTYFPNPANNELNLDAGTRSIDTATIYNILGQAVIDQTVGGNSTRLDVANLSVGTYIMKVVVEGEVGIYKIVKK